MSTTDDVVDVLVIGAGFAGAVAALRLVESGFSVTCLEQGDWTNRFDYPGSSDAWELLAAKQWSPAPHVRDRPGDYPIDLTASDVGVLNFNGVGGGGILYGAQWPRMRPDDFRVRSVDGVAEDWPIGYDDLQPYYEETDRQLGVSGLGGNPAYPPGVDPPMPPLPIGAAGMLVARAHARLGWHWWPGPSSITSTAYRGRNPCVQRGACMSGCNEGAKASTDLTHWPQFLAAGGRLLTGATVTRLLVDEHGLAAGATWADRGGRTHRVRADAVILAANAIGTPRLLLASAHAGAPNGLANSSGLVGRNLMVHPLASVGGLFDEPLDGWRAHAGGLIQSLEFQASDPTRGFVRGATWALGTAGGPLRAVFSPTERGRWGDAHHAHVRERLGRTASWVLIAEDLPEPGNHIDLSPTATDAAGVPVPRVHYRISQNTEALLAWQVDRARESLHAAGAHQIFETRHAANGHFMGTARMGHDAMTSVVDPYGLAHDIPNLAIVDGSVFVTGGSANPTSTTVALALRTADHLVRRRGQMPRPTHPRPIAFEKLPTLTSNRDVVAAPTETRDHDLAAPDAGTTLPTPTRPLSADARAVLRTIADQLIPASDGLPSASDVHLAGELVDRVLALRPDLRPGLDTALRELATMAPSDLVSNAEKAGPGSAIGQVCYVVTAAYYLSPSVRASMGYEPEPPTPVRALDFPEYVEEGLLDHLLS